MEKHQTKGIVKVFDIYIYNIFNSYRNTSICKENIALTLITIKLRYFRECQIGRFYNLRIVYTFIYKIIKCNKVNKYEMEKMDCNYYLQY